jgi:hypothetical protein
LPFAKLAATQRQKLELEIGVMQRDLIPASTVEQVWGGMTTAARRQAHEKTLNQNPPGPPGDRRPQAA